MPGRLCCALAVMAICCAFAFGQTKPPAPPATTGKQAAPAAPKSAAPRAPKAAPAAKPKPKPKATPTTTLPQFSGPPGAAPYFRSASPTLEVVRLGYSRTIRPGAWAPIQAILKNGGPDADVEFVVFAEESDGTRQPMVTHAPIHMPALSTRIHTTYALLDRCDKVVFELYQGGRRIARQEMEPFQAGLRETMLYAASEGTEVFSCRQEDQRETAGRLRFHNAATMGDMPDRSQGYEPMDAIVLGSLPEDGLSVTQEKAVTDWVRAGGLLVLTPGALPDHYAGTMIEAISPAQITGVRHAATLPPLARLYGPGGGKGVIGLAECAVRDGVVSLRMGDFPLIVSRREGAGAVVFVAFDLTAEQLTAWPPLRSVYLSLLNGTERLPRPAGTRAATVAAEALNNAVGVRVLPRWALATVLGVYLAGVLAALGLLRGRREWAFVALVAAAPVAAGVIDLIGLSASGITGASLAGIHVLGSESGSRRAAGVGYCALLTPNESHCDISLPERPGAFFSSPITSPIEVFRTSHAAAENAVETTDYMDSDPRRLRDVHVRPRAITTFEADYGAPMSGDLETAAQAGPDGIRLRVTNRSNRALTRVFAVCNRNAAPVGDLNPGASATVTLTAGSACGMMADFAGTGLRSRTDVERDRIFAAIFARPGGILCNTGAMTAGWFDAPPVNVEVKGLASPPRVMARTLWMAGADVRVAPGRLLLPKGTLDLLLNQPKIGFDEGRWVSSPGKRAAEAEFLLPVEARGMKPSRVEFFLAFSGAPVLAEVEARNVETGRYEPVLGGAGKPAPWVRGRIAFSPPEKYLDPAAGSVRLRVTATPANLAILSPTARRPFLFTDFDLEIEGTRE